MNPDELLATRRPYKFRAYDPKVGEVDRWSFAHENSYWDDFEPPDNFLPDAIFNLLPGVTPGIRRPSSGVLAGNPYREPVGPSYVADYPSEEEARAALAEAVRRYKDANP